MSVTLTLTETALFVVGAAYATVAIVIAATTARSILVSLSYGGLDAADYVFAGVVGLLAGAFWLLWLPFYLFGRLMGWGLNS